MTILKATVRVSVQENSYETLDDYIGYIKDACELSCAEYGTVSVEIAVDDRLPSASNGVEAKSTAIPTPTGTMSPETTIEELMRDYG